jgi:hypothetical protein
MSSPTVSNAPVVLQGVDVVSEFLQAISTFNASGDKDQIRVSDETVDVWRRSSVAQAVLACPPSATERDVEVCLCAALAGIYKMKLMGQNLKDRGSVMLLSGELIAATDMVHQLDVIPNPNEPPAGITGSGDADDEDDAADVEDIKKMRAQVAAARKDALRKLGPQASAAAASGAGGEKPAPRTRMTHAQRMAARAAARKK